LAAMNSKVPVDGLGSVEMSTVTSQLTANLPRWVAIPVPLPSTDNVGNVTTSASTPCMVPWKGTPCWVPVGQSSSAPAGPTRASATDIAASVRYMWVFIRVFILGFPFGWCKGHLALLPMNSVASAGHLLPASDRFGSNRAPACLAPSQDHGGPGLASIFTRHCGTPGYVAHSRYVVLTESTFAVTSSWQRLNRRHAAPTVEARRCGGSERDRGVKSA
jgi:hypothetical protein